MASDVHIVELGFLVSLSIFVIVFLLMVTVTLLNRAKAVVPPPLRDQPGAIEEWIEAYGGEQTGERGAQLRVGTSDAAERAAHQYGAPDRRPMR